MADSKIWKVYRGGKMVAATKHAEDAAAVVGMSGGQIKAHGRVVFTQPGDASGVDASDSWDSAAQVCHDRLQAHQRQRHARAFGHCPKCERRA